MRHRRTLPPIAKSLPHRERGFRFEIARPSEGLSGAVAYYWLLEVSPDVGVRDPAELMIPDGYDEIIFSYSGPFERSALGGVASAQTGSYVSVGRAQSVTARCLGGVRMIGIKLVPPIWHQLTGVPGGELPSGILSLDELSDAGLNELEQRLSEVRAIDDVATLCDELIARRLASQRADEILVRAVKLLQRGRGAGPIGRISKELGLHPRTLEKRAKRNLGLTLKTLAQVLRFKHGFHWCHAGPHRDPLWYDCGYCDQSHFIRDFRRFTGVAPGALLRGDPRWSTAVIEHSFRTDVPGRKPPPWI